MKSIVIVQDKCTGCRLCMLACSFKKEREYNLERSRIALLQVDGENIPLLCHQCINAPCIKACPVEAIKRKDGIVRIDEGICIGCRVCIDACPFGAISLDPENEKLLKCDLCEGDPECVKYCAYQAIEFMDEGERVHLKRMGSLEDLKG